MNREQQTQGKSMKSGNRTDIRGFLLDLGQLTLYFQVEYCHVETLAEVVYLIFK